MKVVEVNDFFSENLYPNSGSNQNYLTGDYEVLSANSAYLIVMNVLNNGSSNYILNLTNNTDQLPLSNLMPGNYQIYLVCKWIIQDSKRLSIY
ncbi:MAG: hypothetical protein ACI9DK_000803 [Vicingaceae bacterium]